MPGDRTAIPKAMNFINAAAHNYWCGARRVRSAPTPHAAKNTQNQKDKARASRPGNKQRPPAPGGPRLALKTRSDLLDRQPMARAAGRSFSGRRCAKAEVDSVDPAMANWTTRLFDEIGVGESASYARPLSGRHRTLVVPPAIASLARPNIAGGCRLDAGHRGQCLSCHRGRHAAARPGSTHLRTGVWLHRPLCVGDVLTATVVVREKSSAGRQLLLDAKCINQQGAAVTAGTLRVDCPAERRRVERLGEVEVAFHRYNAFRRSLSGCRASRRSPLRSCIPATGNRCLAPRRRGEGPDRPGVGRARGEDSRRGGRGKHRPCRVRIVATEHSHAAASEGGCDGARRRGRGADEGQPAHRRTDGRGRRRRRPACAPSDASAMFRDGRTDVSETAARH